MNLERLLLLHTAALAVMGALFLGLGQNNAAMPIALAFAAVVATTFSDRVSWLKLNRIVANFVALGAVVWSLRDFFDRASDGQLLAIADMLVFLQIVLLFQEKTSRVYWQLLVLSLLQVVVAAALNLGPQFGLLLALYITVALSALVLLCIDRECHPDEPAKARPAPSSRWSALLESPGVGAARQLSQQMGPLQSSRLVLSQVIVVALATFTFTVVFFYSTPRQMENQWQGPRSRMQTTIGFPPEVVLERSGRVQQSNELVMRVSLTRLADRRPYIMLGDPYFHGMVLTDYLSDGRRHRWVATQSGPRTARTISPFIARPADPKMLIRQEIVLESQNSPALFAILPYHRLLDTPTAVRFLRHAQRLVRVPSDDFTPQNEYRYAVGTMGLRDGRTLRVTPHPNPVANWGDALNLHEETERLTKFDAAKFPKVRQLAEQIIREAGLQTAPTLDKMLALQSHFLTEGNYTYTIDQDFPHDPSLDPIEDFVANHRRGHCEYFASALLMMLRSQNIPARMVIGYKGGEFNSLGHYYQVRQKDAHSWVEAYLPPEEVPAAELGSIPSPGGGWYRLDPTPAQLVVLTEGQGIGLFDKMGEAMDYVDLMWRDYVLGLNSVRQRDKLYDPLTAQTVNAVPVWMDANRMQSRTRRMVERMGLKKSEGASRWSRWSWSQAIIFLTAVMAAGIFIRSAWWLFRRYLPHAKRRSGDRLALYRSPPAFYLRFVRLLAGVKLRRASGQTARELAASAAQCLSASGEAPGIESLPADVVAAYYRVRFGGATLDNQETVAIEQALAKIAHVVRRKQHNRKKQS